jgi:uncharacterized membrane protein HdeD (DUF308 family)
MTGVHPDATDPPPRDPRQREPALTGTERGWTIALGILLILAGIVAIAFPLASGLTITILAGWLLMLIGVLQLAHAFVRRSAGGMLWDVLVGMILTVGGFLVLANPLEGTLTLTVLLAAVFLAEGAIEITAALAGRTRRNWSWTLASGLAAMLAGSVIAFGLPGSAAWAIGLVVGLKFMFTGIRYLAVAGKS